MSFLSKNLIFRCCIEEVLEADGNAIKTFTLCVKSLSGNCDYQKYLFSNKPKLFQHPREMYSEAVMAFD